MTQRKEAFESFEENDQLTKIATVDFKKLRLSTQDKMDKKLANIAALFGVVEENFYKLGMQFKSLRKEQKRQRC